MLEFRSATTVESVANRLTWPMGVGCTLLSCLVALTLATIGTTALCVRHGIAADAWCIAGVGTELLMLVAASWCFRSIARRIRLATDVSASIAAGSLSFVVRPSGRDELSELLKSLERTRQSLARMAAVTQQGAARLAHAVGAIACENEELAARTTAQAAALEQSAAAISEFASIAQQNAARGAQGEQLSQSVSSQADHVDTSISCAAAMIHDVRSDAAHIASITATVNAIAVQTRLLALNAAIVSAKAGKQGRGFSVVAAEVRKLANRTVDAAREIANLTSNAEKTAERAEVLAETAQSEMKRLVDRVRKLTQSNAAVNVASLEQCSAARELETAISSVDELTQQNAQRVGSIATTAGALHAQATDLLALTNRFERGTRAHAVWIVSNAVKYIDSVGLELACEEFTHGETFKELDLYVVVYDYGGLNLAQGADPSMVGRNMLELKDVNQIPIVRRLIEIASAQESGWLDRYSFTNPVTGALDSKSMYVRRAPGNVLVGCGVYGS